MNRYLVVLLVAALATGCASTRPGGYYQDDGPHDRPRVDVSKIPDAVPHREPINERSSRPYSVFGVSYRPLPSASGYRERGVASWYGKKFHGQRTSNGETYDMYAMTAAHKTLPLPSYARVTNLNNGKSVVVRVNDRGPFLDNRLIDLSYAAAYRLGILGTGTGLVEVEGLSGDQPVTTVATAAPAKLSPIATAEAAPAPRLYLQAGAFGSRDNADNLRNRLVEAKIVPVHVEPAQVGGQALFRVRIGPLDSVEASDRIAEQVRSQGFPKPIVVVE